MYGDNSRASQELWAQFMNLQVGDAEPDAGVHEQSQKMFSQFQEQMQSQARNMFSGSPSLVFPLVSKPRTIREAVTEIGFVSLGCPKALVDSERILTQLRAEGYVTCKTYAAADLVIVNTCGFIDAAVEESLATIGEALAGNGKVVVTGCLGAKQGVIRKVHPSVLAVTGPHDSAAVMDAVHAHLPKPHDPYTDLIPDIGVKLTPRHYAYLKISEGCNHRCSFCIIPSMRGDLVSRPIGEVMLEAENLVKAGVKELLVIAQDTSAYGVDLDYRTGFWGGRPVKTRMLDLCKALGELGVWVRLHYVYPIRMSTTLFR